MKRRSCSRHDAHLQLLSKVTNSFPLVKVIRLALNQKNGQTNAQELVMMQGELCYQCMTTAK